MSNALLSESFREVPPANIRGVVHAQHESDPAHPRLTRRTGRHHTKTVCGQPSGYAFARLIHSFDPDLSWACGRCTQIVRAAILEEADRG